MTVQELIEALNKVKDKSKEVLQNYYFSIDGIEERDDYVIVVLKEIQYDNTRKDTEESRGIWAARPSVSRRCRIRTRKPMDKR